MPQDGTNNYYYPLGTPGIPDQTIESEAYNTFLDDLVTNDLNIPRPIHRGGTAGTSKLTARTNLSVEVSAVDQEVTNYDAHVFQTGSFYSQGGIVPSQPVAGHAFVGHAVVYANPDYAAIHATDITDSVAPGRTYVRTKSAAVWSAWQVVPNATGPLTVNGKIEAAQDGRLLSTNNTSGYATVTCHAATFGTAYCLAVGGENTLQFRAANNAGDPGSVLGYFNASGDLYAIRNLHALGSIYSGNIVSAAGDVYAAGDPYFRMAGGGNIRNYYFGSNSHYLQFDSTIGYRLVVNNSIAFTVDGSAQFIAHVAAYKPGGGPWADSSDARIKNVEGDYTRGLNDVAALRPVLFTFKGNDTPVAPAHPPQLPPPAGEPEVKQEDGPLTVPYPNSPHRQQAIDGTKFSGLIAQEVEAVFPEMVTPRSAYIDGVAVTDLRDLDTAPLIFALINAVKELKTRVEQLEAV